MGLLYLNLIYKTRKLIARVSILRFSVTQLLRQVIIEKRIRRDINIVIDEKDLFHAILNNNLAAYINEVIDK